MPVHQTTSFGKDISGTVAPIFGLAVIVLVLVSGLAIDGSRAFRAASRVSAALDAAAIATARQLTLYSTSDSELKTLAVSYFESNLRSSGNVEVTYGEVTLSSDRTKGAVTLNVDARLPTTIGRLMNIEAFEIPRSATALDQSKDIELSMMLDLSGSMRGSKIAALKDAASDLVDIIMNANASGAKNRIAIAPYSTSVNVGSFVGRATSSSDHNTCVTERTGANAFTDKAPTGGLFNKKASYCPASEIVPLTDNTEDLYSHISGMSPNGWTAGHLGIAWAWYLVSPQWASVWPSGSTPTLYSDPTVIKAVVIMTDGEFNTAYEPANGDSKTQSRNLCDGMKAAGITVFSVAFQAPANALPVLQYCASSSDHFFDAQSAEGLSLSFQEIAKKMSVLRLAG